MKNKIIIAGGSGFLGQALSNHFKNSSWEVFILTRSPNQLSRDVREIFWDASTMGPWQEEFEGACALINLTGKSVNCRYHKRHRDEILNSRINSTRVLGEAIGLCANPPPVWLNASTATIYKHNFGPAWSEAGLIGAVPEAKDAFSIEVATAWEREFQKAQTPRTRKVALRTAMVLGHGKNSVFPTLQRLVRLGLGGKMGTGNQFVSWIHERDFCRAIEWLIEHEEISGVVNLAAPNPLPNQEMMQTLRELSHARFGLPATLWMLELGAFFLRTETELIIKSRRVIPHRLLETGFRFDFPLIRQAFQDLRNSADRNVWTAAASAASAARRRTP
jgi:uncharacterized protein